LRTEFHENAARDYLVTESDGRTRTLHKAVFLNLCETAAR